MTKIHDDPNYHCKTLEESLKLPDGLDPLVYYAGEFKWECSQCQQTMITPGTGYVLCPNCFSYMDYLECLYFADPRYYPIDD